jgi:hypothetical protein
MAVDWEKPVSTMTGFGRKTAWLAIREGDPEAVLAALDARDLGPVRWRDGIDVSYLTDDRIVLTPLLPGAGGARWLMVTGRRLLGSRAAIDVAALSRTLGTEVQFFATYRVGELHRWARAIDGELTRLFTYVGETGEVELWFGDPDRAERELGLPATEDGGLIMVSEKDVLRLAGAWSVNPDELDGRPAPGELRAAAVG